MTDLQAQLSAALADRDLLERELGRGGMTMVYLAHELKHDRPVAHQTERQCVKQARKINRCSPRG